MDLAKLVSHDPWDGIWLAPPGLGDPQAASFKACHDLNVICPSKTHVKIWLAANAVTCGGGALKRD